MAQSIKVNVYEIDGKVVTTAFYGFSVAGCKFRNYDGSNTGTLNAIIEFGGKTHAVVETVAALVTAANA
jgi:hypothetical protein